MYPKNYVGFFFSKCTTKLLTKPSFHTSASNIFVLFQATRTSFTEHDWAQLILNKDNPQCQRERTQGHNRDPFATLPIPSHIRYDSMNEVPDTIASQKTLPKKKKANQKTAKERDPYILQLVMVCGCQVLGIVQLKPLDKSVITNRLRYKDYSVFPCSEVLIYY